MYWDKTLETNNIEKYKKAHSSQQDNKDLTKLQDLYEQELNRMRKEDLDLIEEKVTQHLRPFIGDRLNVNLSNVKAGKKESDGKLEYELDWDFIQLMAEVMAKNKGSKYPPYNWKKPMDVEKLKQALLRHTVEIMKGNYGEEGIELSHFASVALNAMMAAFQIRNNK